MDEIGVREDACVFCARDDQPETLLETPLLYAMPDKYPLVPGHTLIITKTDYRCYALAEDEVHRELDATARLLGTFLEEAYGLPVFALENGIAGQSVPHAHLHLVPIQVPALSDALVRHPDVFPIAGWKDVREFYRTRGPYRYLEAGGCRYVASGYAIRPELRAMMTEGAGIEWDEDSAIRRTPASEIDVLLGQWRAWTGGRTAS